MSHPARDSGFTLIEAMVTVALLGVLMAISISGWSSWAKASAHSGTASQIQSVLEQAHQRAVAEGVAMCVLFDTAGNSYAVFRGDCAAHSVQPLVGPYRTESGVYLDSPSFDSAEPAGCTLYARGTATEGSVLVKRVGSSTQYVLDVEGLTSRVTRS